VLGFLNAKVKPLRNTERILIYYRSKPTYNPIFVPGKPYRAKNGACSSNYGVYKNKILTDNPGYRYPTEVLYFDTPIRAKQVHPTQKPVELCEWLIQTYTNPNEIVLDNCAGSGTTGVAAQNLGRRFIGFEKDKAYFESAKERLNI
jgi:site-specific DNA-methyltransferase (adenine-specific)